MNDALGTLVSDYPDVHLRHCNLGRGKTANGNNKVKGRVNGYYLVISKIRLQRIIHYNCSLKVYLK